ncbi:WbqC family protein [Thiospirillum jenense]|uniref:WbqC family protein n=1 Tax=Thiospirillum jenense TaxID=1653858 RepID=A0A839HDU9_9GAMM|nr:WbqC family protein [Thiospirillum jenense]MBB1127105.1 WbqC family protein [Thiospirillum jenense]
MKNVVVLQSNYIPWKGYFDLIHDADLFVFYDDLQFTKNDWRNRNKIKTQNGCEWLTIPVGANEKRLICEVEIKDSAWQIKHWKSIHQCYGKSDYFLNYKDIFEHVYLEQRWASLSVLNQYLICLISNNILNIKTEFKDSREYDLSGKKLDRLLELVVKTGATRYISGPAAKDYIDPARFVDAGIDLVWKEYSGYPEYPQRFPPFEHGVSILDLLFNVGPDAPWYIWGWRDDENRLA